MKMRVASSISAGLHILVLGWAAVSFSGEHFEATPTESLPVDLVSEKEFSELTKGIKDAPKPTEQPKPVVEKITEEPPKPIEESKPKVVENKKEVAFNKEMAPPPEPEAVPDPIADKIEKLQDKPQEAKAQPPRLPPKRPPRPKPLDLKKLVQAALLDKRDPARNAATGAELNNTPSLGTASSSAALLSQSEKDALKRRIESCWHYLPGTGDNENVEVVFRFQMRRDGTISHGPEVIKIIGSSASFGPQFAEGGRRAILQCQPYRMLRQETYDDWKDIEIGFSSKAMYQ